MSIEKSDYIWLNGKFVPWDEAKTHVLDHGLHYGTGVFEGIRAYETTDGNTAIFRLEEHVERFFRSARSIHLDIPYTQSEVIEIISEVVRKNELKECYIRPLVWNGYRELGLHARDLPVNVMVAVWRWGEYLKKEGIKAKVSTWIRNNPNSFPSDAKIAGGYINSVLATHEARRAGYDEAIMLDYRGFISEGPGENLFIIENNTILTPPLHASILRGITRDTVIVLAREVGYEVHEIDLHRSRLYHADEALFTGTAAEIAPIHEVDGMKIGSGETGPITKKLQKAYFDTIRDVTPSHKNWLTFV